jgi:hypothetical protein
LKPLPLNAVATTIEPSATVSMIGGSDLDNLDAQLDRLREILRGLTVEEPVQ